MREKLILFSLGFILFLLICIWSYPSSQSSGLDVLLITIDTLRADYLSCYDKTKIETSHIDQLASRGLLFLNAFAHNVMTLPSHINILTGTYPFFHGVRDNAGFWLEEESLLISEILKEKGYSTAAFIGAFPLDDRFGLDQGFDLYDDFYGDPSTPAYHTHLHNLFFVERPAEDVIDAACSWIKDQGENSWFCWIHLFDPHVPYIPPQIFKERYPSDFYGGEVAYVDQELGRLFQFLGKRENKDYPLTVITSDHGESLGEHGELTHGVFAYNSTLHIPLIIYQPQLFPKSKVIQEMVRHIDIAPTILDVLGIKIPGVIQGRSLLPLVKNPSRWKMEDCYFEALSPNLNRNWAPLHGLIRGNYKFISLPASELYDLKKDFREENNLAAKENPLAIELKKDLDSLLQTKKQPLSARRSIDRETREKLHSLGYIAGADALPEKRSFSAEDDPKNLIGLDREMQEGIMVFQTGGVEKAAKIFEEILEQRQDYKLIYENLSFIYRERGQLGKAIKLLEKAIDLKLDDSSLMSKLAIYYQEAGKLEKAKTILESLAKSFPHDVEILNYLGVTYWKLESFEEAIKIFQKAIAMDKGYASLYNNFGSVYLSLKDYSQAEEKFKKALSYDQNLASAYNGLGIIRANENNLPQAAKNWKKAVELDKTQYDALYNLCIILTKMNQFEDALKYIERFIASAPPNKYGSDIEKMKELLSRLKAALKKKD
jgi:arylsulfatase A-like enzyme/Flp pilus assembly protein TadD